MRVLSTKVRCDNRCWEDIRRGCVRGGEVRWEEMRKVTLTVKGHLGGPETVKDTWGGPSDAANEGHLGGLDTSVEGHLGGLETVEGHFRRALLQMKDTWAGPTHQHIFLGNAGILGPRPVPWATVSSIRAVYRQRGCQQVAQQST